MTAPQPTRWATYPGVVQPGFTVGPDLHGGRWKAVTCESVSRGTRVGFLPHLPTAVEREADMLRALTAYRVARALAGVR